MSTAPFDQLTALVTDDLGAVNELIRERMASEHAPRIPAISAHLIEAGGKRLRPILTLAAAQLCGYSGRDHVKLAATVEFISGILKPGDCLYIPAKWWHYVASLDFTTIAQDEMWLSSMLFCAETCAMLGDKENAEFLYPLLLPYAEQVGNYPNGVCFGATARHLGLLAAVSGRFELAQGHFEFALDLNRRIGAWPALVRTQVNYGEMLLESNADGALQMAGKILAEAEQLSDKIEMAGMNTAIAELLGRQTVILPDNLSTREAEVLKLIAIGRSNKDISKAL